MRKLKYFIIPLILGILIASCEKDDTNVIDPRITFPNITAVFISPNTFDTTALTPVLVAVIQSEEQVTNVNSRVTNPLGTVLADVELKDDGVLPDTTAGDSRYSGQLNIVLLCKLIGSYKVEFVAKNVSGVSGNIVVSNFVVTSSFNNPPFIDNLIIPDSLRRPTGVGGDTVNIGFLQVRASDPDGLCDIFSAYFNSFRPNGIQNVFNEQLYDDGNILLHGDSVANDGKYSLLIKITPNASDTSIGYFRFEFNAKDRGNLISNTIIDSINVHR